MSVLSSPPFRKFFIRLPPESETSEILIGKKRGVELKGNSFYVFWLLCQLWEDGDFLFNASLPIVVDELNRLIQSEPEARNLMSPFIAKEVRDLSIIWQCVNQLELYLPWARRFEAQLVERDEILKKAYAECTAPWAHVMTAIKEVAAKPGVVNLGEPSTGKFTYPIKKGRNRENVEVLRRSEAHLDAFWALFDELVIERAGEVSGEPLTCFLSRSRILKRTSEWVEPEKLPSQKSEQNGVSDEAEPYLSHQSASLINTSLSEKALDLPLPKTKVKTRGVSALEENGSVDEAIAEPSLPDQPSFAVDTSAFKVFSTIFHQPARSAPVELHWTDFLYAMTSIGFSATKVDGSVWQFQPISQPISLEVERSITFHQPHSSKIPSRVARRIGGRLSRVYGWCGETFLLAEK
ncbi:hypothetical protein N7488_000640 [Penicillium malachiteum]|nr:hypothetical protein N7488_000640 [Penicillium malachiteum]